MNKSFTLIEILVVIVVIGVLSAFILVGMNSISSKANIAKGQAFSNSLRNSLLMNLISEWKFDDQSNLGKDYWGLNSGTNYSTIYKTDNCVSNGCIDFNQQNYYIEVVDSNSLDELVNAITVESWVYYVDKGDVDHPIVTKTTGTDPNLTGGWGLWYGYALDLRFSVANDILAVTSGAYNQWHHIVGTYDRQKIKIYVDGVQAGEKIQTSQISTNDHALWIGYSPRGSYHWGGRLDEIYLYKEAISSSKINQNYYIGINKLFRNNGIVTKEYNQRLSELRESLSNK
jgi:prepilin-type N-terminal cleavage/methylation domain-containing protein